MPWAFGRFSVENFFQRSQGDRCKLRSIPVARPSRPPGFDMTYRPSERVYLPPWRQRLPAMIYLLVASALFVIVLVAEASSSNSELYVRIIEQNSRRIITPRTFAILVLASAIAAGIQSGMRGVRIRGDGIEYRDIVSGFWPKLKRVRWPQIDCVVLDVPEEVVLELWDNSRTYLPKVADRVGLAQTLEKVAMARAIPVRGGVGLDEIPEPEDELEETPAV